MGWIQTQNIHFTGQEGRDANWRKKVSFLIWNIYENIKFSSSMASLLAKFRIDYANLTMVHDVSAKPSAKTYKLFDKVIRPFRGTPSNAHDKRISKSQKSITFLIFAFV